MIQCKLRNTLTVHKQPYTYDAIILSFVCLQTVELVLVSTHTMNI